MDRGWLLQRGPDTRVRGTGCKVQSTVMTIITLISAALRAAKACPYSCMLLLVILLCSSWAARGIFTRTYVYLCGHPVRIPGASEQSSRRLGGTRGRSGRRKVYSRRPATGVAGIAKDQHGFHRAMTTRARTHSRPDVWTARAQGRHAVAAQHGQRWGHCGRGRDRPRCGTSCGRGHAYKPRSIAWYTG